MRADGGVFGWGDMFAAKHTLAADYYLMQGEDSPPSELYLFQGNNSGSIAGAIHQIGWNKDFILVNDTNGPVQWKVIDVKQHKTTKITEAQRLNSKQLSAIALLDPDLAWENSGAR